MWDKEWVREKVEHTNVLKMHMHPHGEDYRCTSCFFAGGGRVPLLVQTLSWYVTREERAEARPI